MLQLCEACHEVEWEGCRFQGSWCEWLSDLISEIVPLYIAGYQLLAQFSALPMHNLFQLVQFPLELKLSGPARGALVRSSMKSCHSGL